MADHHLWIEVLEYLLAAVAAVITALFLSGVLETPLWVGLLRLQ